MEKSFVDEFILFMFVLTNGQDLVLLSFSFISINLSNPQIKATGAYRIDWSKALDTSSIRANQKKTSLFPGTAHSWKICTDWKHLIKPGGPLRQDARRTRLYWISACLKWDIGYRGNCGLFQSRGKTEKFEALAPCFSMHWHNPCYQITVCSFFKVV